jgi:hypothetical protein
MRAVHNTLHIAVGGRKLLDYDKRRCRGGSVLDNDLLDKRVLPASGHMLVPRHGRTGNLCGRTVINKIEVMKELRGTELMRPARVRYSKSCFWRSRERVVPEGISIRLA